jgi:uncharacterized protein involved in type VI secretion and phage assembly
VSFRRLSEISEREQRNKVYGVVVAIVTNNKDDQKGHYRVKVRFPWLPNGGASNAEESDWCRIATPMAGNGRGLFLLPEVGDEVLVAFEHGDIARPYVVGCLWNGEDKETYDNKGGKNNMRAFKSRSGHVLEFCDDKEGKKEKITVKSAAGARVVIDDSDSKKIEIYDDQSNNYVLIDAQNKKITVESKNGEILLKAKEKITLEAKAIETKSDQDTKMTVGANFELKAQSNMTLKASGQGDIESSATMTIKGATVNIN